MADLIVPVYLNQRVVFDLVAMLQGGIATVTKVAESTKEASSDEGEARASLGLNRALSALLRIDSSGRVKSKSGEEAGQSRAEERVHTPASLFFTLRNLLVEKNLLKEDSDHLAPTPGQIIEMTGTLSRNPVIEVMSTVEEMMRLSTVGADPKKAKETRETEKQASQARHLVQQLKAGDTVDLTTGQMKSGYRAVLTLEEQYLNDPAMADLVDGTFTVTGKIVRVVGKDCR